MENLRRQSYSESLKTTLNCYQLSSADSLSGPSGYSALAAQLWFKDNKQAPPNPPPPLIQIPLLMPNDTSTQRAETVLAGERIACFIVGGEKRLCLPQILTTVLREFSIADINRTCAELHIYCSRCSPDQLEILKVIGILPFNTTQCGLITKTDAERLVSTLGVDYPMNSKYHPHSNETKGLQVYHECFGRGDGIFHPDLYTLPDAPCIVCMDCKISFSPAKFVSHSHRSLEKHTCHWGFDPENWRSYLLLPKDTHQSVFKEHDKLLTSLKAKFDISPQRTNTSSPPSKRRHEPEPDPPQSKKIKSESRDDSLFLPTSPRIPPLCYGLPFGLRPSSSFKPWLSGLPASVAQLPEVRAAQDEALLRVLAPMMHDRRLLPGYLQFGPPTVLPVSESIVNWSAPSLSTKAAPNITLAPAEYQKRTASLVVDRDSKSEKHSRPGESSERRAENRRSSTSMASPQQAVNEERRSETTNHAGRTSADTDRIPEQREADVQTKDPDRRRSHSGPHKSPSRPSERDHARRKLTDTPPARPTAESPPDVAMSKAVAAASAMLELSSAAKANHQRKTSAEGRSSSPPPVPREGQAGGPPSLIPLEALNRKQASASSSRTDESEFPQVVPLNRDLEHFKWTYSGSSYIVSAAGTQELKVFHSLLDAACSNSTLKQQISHELVKMKACYEERLDIQARVKRDLEAELDRVKASKKQRLQEAASVRNDLKLQMEKMRLDHDVRIDEMKQQLEKLQAQNGNCDEDKKSDAPSGRSEKQALERLRKEIAERGETADELRMSLANEREMRLRAEMQLDELAEGARGRIPFLMDGALSTMIRSSRKPSDESSGKNRAAPLSASGRKNLETIVSSSSSSFVHQNGASPNGGSHGDDVIDITDVSGSPGEAVRLSAKDRGAHDVAPA